MGIFDSFKSKNKRQIENNASSEYISENHMSGVGDHPLYAKYTPDMISTL